jgi:hypothetical protein
MGRRGLIAGSSISGLLLLAAVTGVAKAHEPDGELIRMCNEAVKDHAASLKIERKIVTRLKYGTPESAAAWKAICARTNRWFELCDRIADTPARTPEGIRAKASVLVPVVAMEEPLVASLCRDLLGSVRVEPRGV